MWREENLTDLLCLHLLMAQATTPATASCIAVALNIVSHLHQREGAAPAPLSQVGHGATENLWSGLAPQAEHRKQKIFLS